MWERETWRVWLGIVFAISLIMTFAFGFNGLQAYNIVSAFQYYVPDFEHSNIPLAIGIILCVICLILFFGAQNDMEVAWSLADITMGLEAVVNIIAILLLSHIAFKALSDYEKKKAEGKDPVFCKSDIGLDNTDVWKATISDD